MGEAAIGVASYAAGVMSALAAIAVVILRGARSLENSEEMQYRYDQTKALRETGRYRQYDASQ